MANKPVSADQILELLHNSWLEDDYDSEDPDAMEAKRHLAEAVEAIIGGDFTEVTEYDKAINGVLKMQRKRLAEWLGEKK